MVGAGGDAAVGSCHAPPCSAAATVEGMGEDERMPAAIEGMKLDEEGDGGRPVKKEQRGGSESPNGTATTPPLSDTSPDESKPASDSSSSPDAVQASKLPRKASQKPAGMAVKLFDQLPDATEEACTHFQVINDCLYGSKHMGSTDIDALDCDCNEEWRRFSVPFLILLTWWPDRGPPARARS